MPCPYGKPGDRLWVREAHVHNSEGWEQEQFGKVTYKADFDSAHPEMQGVAPGSHGNWNPSMYMPRWASRLTLEVTAVDVQRLQDISEADARAEGVVQHESKGSTWYSAKPRAGMICRHARPAFIELWDSINAERGYGFAVNPFVWVVGFKVVGTAKGGAAE